MPGSPEATIVTATYNKPEFLAEAAQSVLKQTFEDWTWWIILDGADQATTALAGQLFLQDERVMVIDEKTTTPQRRAEYRPAAIINKYYPKVATKYLCWLSDDDLLEPVYLEFLIDALRAHRRYDVAYGACESITQVGPRDWKPRRKLPADRPLGKGTGVSPKCRIDGGQILQTKRSYDALKGYQLPTVFESAEHVDGIYMDALAQRFTFFPVPQKVLTRRHTYLSTHFKGSR